MFEMRLVFASPRELIPFLLFSLLARSPFGNAVIFCASSLFTWSETKQIGKQQIVPQGAIQSLQFRENKNLRVGYDFPTLPTMRHQVGSFSVTSLTWRAFPWMEGNVLAA